MKRNLFKFGIITVLVSMLAVPSYGQEIIVENINPNGDYTSNQSITPYAANIVWKNKIVNGVKYKRKYNVDTGQWIGDWIKV